MSPSRLPLGGLLLWLVGTSLQAEEAVRFNAGFLHQEQQSIDLERFAAGTPWHRDITPAISM